MTFLAHVGGSEEITYVFLPSVIFFVVFRLVRRRATDVDGLDWRALAIRFAVVQAAGFVILEIVERLVVHAPLGGLVSVLPVGLGVETAVAALVAAILVAAHRATETIASALVRRHRTRRVERPVFPRRSFDRSVPSLR